MSRLDSFSGKMMHLVGQVGDGIRHAVPDNAGQWLQAGAAVGAAKAGSRAVGGFVRRNPAVTIAAAVGVGVLLYAVRRHQKKKQAAGGVIEGQSKRVEARKSAARRSRAAQPEPQAGQPEPQVGDE